MNIPNEVYQGIVAFFQQGQEQEALKPTQIEVQIDGDDSKPYYRAWIHRQTGKTDPETGHPATLLTWAKFSYINEKLTFITCSWEENILNQMSNFNLQPQKQTASFS
jgi:hypothetical protein